MSPIVSSSRPSAFPLQLAILAITGLFSSLPTNAQLPEKVLHSRAGTVVIVDGVVFTDALPADPNHPGPQKVSEIRAGQSVGTRDGRVEMLLGQDIYLRLDHDTTITLENETLTNPTIALEQGTALVEVVLKAKNVHPQIRVGDTTTLLDKPGLYRFDVGGDAATAGQRRLMVFGGSAEVSSTASPATPPPHTIRVRNDETLNLAATPLPQPAPFYRILWKTDPFHVWCADRSYLIYRNGTTHFGRGVQANWGYTRTHFSTWFESTNFDALRLKPVTTKNQSLRKLEEKTNAKVEAKVAAQDAEALAKARAAENAAKDAAKSTK